MKRFVTKQLDAGWITQIEPGTLCGMGSGPTYSVKRFLEVLFHAQQAEWRKKHELR